MERIWRQEGLRVPPRRPKRSRIWPSDGACTRLRAEWSNHVWSYDFAGEPVGESLHRKLQCPLHDELLNGEIFYTLAEARIVIKSWRRFYNTRRPHGSLGYRPPAPEVFIPQSARAAALHQPASPPSLAPRQRMHSHSTRTTRWGLIKRTRPPPVFSLNLRFSTSGIGVHCSRNIRSPSFP